MDYYTNAEEQLEGAKILADSGKYRLAVTLLCLSCELFLKSLVERKDPSNPLLNSHDIVNLGALIKNDVDFKTLAPQLAFMRKYLNDSRYPYDAKAYTDVFYQNCLERSLQVKSEIDVAFAKIPMLKSLQDRFGKDYVKELKNHKTE